MVVKTDSGTRVPQGTDAFAPTTQLKTLSDDESRWNNFLRVANATARNAITAPELRDGILVEDLDTHIIYERISGSWVPVVGPRDVGAVTAGADYSLTGTVLERSVDGWVDLTLQAIRSTGFVSNAQTVGTLPAGFRPPVSRVLPVSLAAFTGDAGQLVIAATGVMTVYLTASGKTGMYGLIRFKAA